MVASRLSSRQLRPLALAGRCSLALAGAPWRRQPAPARQPTHAARPRGRAELGRARSAPAARASERLEDRRRGGRAWRRPAAARRQHLPQPDLLADRQPSSRSTTCSAARPCRGSPRSSRRGRSGSPPISTAPPRLRDEAEEALRQHEAVVAEAQARAPAQLKATQDRLAAEAAQRQAELDAELRPAARRGRGPDRRRPGRGAGADPERRGRGGPGRGRSAWPGSRSAEAEAKAARRPRAEGGRLRCSSSSCSSALIILVVAGLEAVQEGRARRPRRTGGASIRTELDEAQRLHEEAKALLAKYQRQLHEGEKLAADIVAQAEAQRQRFEEKMRDRFRRSR